jgi:hypothetical protein
MSAHILNLVPLISVPHTRARRSVLRCRDANPLRMRDVLKSAGVVGSIEEITSHSWHDSNPRPGMNSSILLGWSPVVQRSSGSRTMSLVNSMQKSHNSVIFLIIGPTVVQHFSVFMVKIVLPSNQFVD